MEEGGEIIAVKPANMLTIEVVTKEVLPNEIEILAAEGGFAAQSLVKATVRFENLNGKKELNGREGTVLVYLQDRERYSVRVDDTGETVAIKPCNLTLVKKAEPSTAKSPLKPSAQVNQSPVKRPRQQKEKSTPKSGSILKKGQCMVYLPSGEKVEIVKVHLEDDPDDPYYTIKMMDGREKQTTRGKLTTEVTVVVAGKSFKESTTRMCREGDILAQATLLPDKSLELTCTTEQFETVMAYLKSLEVEGDRNGLVTLPAGRGGLKKVKKLAELYRLDGLRFMTDKALVELII
eukprot:TRINITY_DN21205_c0_g1_i1.p1 TRINITY_DN21205_c0_g1~~TRINITY_DN21205_c0_g1_i1.p1  ORF type:complete len:292 (-),score=86.96 TRINITY_DN21205_c0_g1_i1:338-1213(-)